MMLDEKLIYGVDLDLDLERLADVLRNTDTMSNGDVALELGDIGIPVLPTVPGDKAPLLTAVHIDGANPSTGERVAPPCLSCKRAGLKPARDHGAATDPDLIRSYWAAHPDAGVGMKNHPRLVRGDADFADGAELRAAQKRIGYGQPDGVAVPFTAYTPGGQYRRRYVHVLPDGCPAPGGGTTIFGVSWYGLSGYTVVKGRHPNGMDYSPFRGDTITPLPPAVVANLLRRPREAGAAAEGVATTAEVTAFLDRHTGTDRLELLARRRHALAGTGEGHRHPTAIGLLYGCFREAVAGYYPARTAHDALRAAYGSTGVGDARLGGEWGDMVAWAVAQVAELDPATARAELNAEAYQRIVDHYDEGYEPTYIDSIEAEAPRDLSIDEIDRLLADDGSTSTAGEAPSERFRRWSITELLDADLSFDWDVTGMLVRPTYGMDTGELKTLKSYFGLSRLVGLTAGLPILGHWRVPQRRR